MKKTRETKTNLVLEIITRIKNEVDISKIDKQEMIRELKMMNFKIKPIIGDLFQVVQKQEIFLESLWKIGKIEEIVSFYKDKLTNEEKDILFHYLESIKSQDEKNLISQLNQRSLEKGEKVSVFEIQVLKKSPSKKNLN